jgi:hypothetical protein
LTRTFILGCALAGIAAAAAVVLITASTVGLADSSGTTGTDAAALAQSVPSSESTSAVLTIDTRPEGAGRQVERRRSDGRRWSEQYDHEDREHDDDD